MRRGQVYHHDELEILWEKIIFSQADNAILLYLYVLRNYKLEALSSG